MPLPKATFRRLTLASSAALALTAAALVVGYLLNTSPATAQNKDTAEKKSAKAQTDDGKSLLSKFMRKKLDASSQILEGLTIEDATLIDRGAKSLTELSKAEIWQVLTDAEYREHSREFRTNTTQLAQAAENGDFDDAALQWIDTFQSCIECHKHVRKARAQQKK